MFRDSLAEWYKALASGASPQGRGLEPHSCHDGLPVSNIDATNYYEDIVHKRRFTTQLTASTSGDQSKECGEAGRCGVGDGGGGAGRGRAGLNGATRPDTRGLERYPPDTASHTHAPALSDCSPTSLHSLCPRICILFYGHWAPNVRWLFGLVV